MSDQGIRHPGQVGNVSAVFIGQGVGPAEGWGEQGSAEGGSGYGGAIAPVGLVAQDNIVGGKSSQ